MSTKLSRDGEGEVSCVRTTLNNARHQNEGKIKLRERERGWEGWRDGTDLKRGSPNWILGKQLGIYYCTCFFVILSQANRSKAAQREKAG